MSDQQITFRIVLDDAGVPAVATRTDASLRGIAAGADTSAKSLAGLGKTGELSAAQLQQSMRFLPNQFSDAFRSIAAGQQPMAVLFQQGSQLRDMFGGFGPALRAVGSLFTVSSVAIGGAAAAVGLLAYAAYEGSQQTSQLAKDFALNGNAAGVSQGQVDSLTQSLATMSRAGMGPAREALYALAGSGVVMGSGLEAGGRAILAVQKISGQTAAQVVADFAGMRNGVAQWAIEHNKASNYLTAAQVEYIKSLELQGRTQEAVRFNLEQYAATMEGRMVPSLGLLDRALQSTSQWWSKMWDAAKGIGRADTQEDEIAQLEKKISEMDAFTRKGGYGGNTDFKDASTRLEMLKKERQRSAEFDSQRADQQRAEQEKTIRNSKAFSDSGLAIDQAVATKALAQDIANAEVRRLAADAAYRRREISADQYTAAIIASERARVNAAEVEARKELDIANRRQVELKPGQLPEQAQREHQLGVLAAEAKLVGVLQRQAELKAKIAADSFRVAPDAGVESAQQAFRTAELAGGGYQQTLALIAQIKLSSDQAAHELIATNRQMGIQLIADDRARGEAEIAEEERTLRQRLQLNMMSVDDRIAAEDRLATWRAQREEKLNRQLETSYQKRAREQFTGADQKGFTEGFVDAGRQGFHDWLVDGKSATDALAKYVRDKFIDAFATKFLDGALAAAGSWVFGGIASLFGAAVHHQGGVVGAGGGSRTVSPQDFMGARRYHQGGLVGGEVPAILMRGEEVLRRDDPRNVLNGGGGGGGATTVVQMGGNTYQFGSDISRPELARYVDARDRQQEAHIRRLLKEQRR